MIQLNYRNWTWGEVITMDPMDYFSHLWTVHLGDVGRGLVIAVLTAPLTIIYDTLNAGSLSFEWKKIAATALAAGVAYLLKNFITGSRGNLLTNK